MPFTMKKWRREMLVVHTITAWARKGKSVLGMELENYLQPTGTWRGTGRAVWESRAFHLAPSLAIF